MLGIERVGIDDDFFRIGGDSILSIQVSRKISALTDSQCSVANIFQYKTIRKILEKVANFIEFNIEKPLCGREEMQPVFFIHPGGGGCEAYQSISESLKDHYYSVGVDNYNIYGNDYISCLDELANFYLDNLKLLENVILDGKKVILAGWSLGGQIALEMASILEQRGCEDISVLLFDTLISDDKHETLLSKIDVTLMIKQKLVNEGANAELIKKAVKLSNVERSIHKCKIQTVLSKSEIILFKASYIDPYLDMGPENEMNRFDIFSYMNGRDNNIRDICQTKLKVVSVDSSHGQILDEIVKNWIPFIIDLFQEKK